MNSAVRWQGESTYALRNLVLKDFRVRYRNMSLGVFWSLLNPLIMMGVLSFVFTQVFPANQVRAFPVFVLCGLLPYNFFALAWATGTNSLIENAPLVRKIPVPRELIPIASVLSNCIHTLIQIGLLLTATILFGFGINWNWLWLPAIWVCGAAFVVGLALGTSAVAVYVRDTRYIVESANLVLFWLVPIFYPFSMIKPEYGQIYQFNPVAAMVLAQRNVLMDGIAPPTTLLWKLGLSSSLVLVLGYGIFQRLKHKMYEYL
jgi:ABC-type polysaccharide/polyol phosphate export permease